MKLLFCILRQYSVKRLAMGNFVQTLAVVVVIYWLISGTSGDNCTQYAFCSQMCHTANKISHCSCMEGFVLASDKKSCSATDPLWILVYATGNAIKFVNTFGHEFVQNQGVSRYDHSPVSVTFDARNNFLYWTDADPNMEAIYKSSIYENQAADIIIDTGLDLPEGIAFDWITGNLYIVDSKKSQIIVCRESPTTCAILVTEKVDKPREIALHPNQGLMFWTDWGKIPAIMKSGMDGSSVKPIVLSNIKWPNGITVDEGNARVYWVDARTDRIESSLFDGSDRRIISISEHLKHPFGVDIFGDRIFWSDWTSKTIQSTNKFFGHDKKPSIETHVNGPLDIHGLAVIHEAKQPVLRTNPCRSSNCSHVCTLSPKSSTKEFQCICPVGMKLDKSLGNICVEDSSHTKLVVAYGNTFGLAYWNSIGKNIFEEIQLPISSYFVTNLVYWPSNHSLIMSIQGHTSLIIEYKLVSKEFITLVEQEVEQVISMTIDPVSETLFWFDLGQMRVEAVSLQTRARIVLPVSTPNLLSITVDPENGMMYVSRGNVVNRFQIDENCIESQFFVFPDWHVQKLLYDHENQGILCVGQNDNKFEFISLKSGTTKNGTVVEALIQDLATLSNVTIWVGEGSNVYIVDQGHKQIIKVPFINRQATQIPLESNFPWIAGRKQVTVINPDISYLEILRNEHECSPGNLNRKKCSHICLPTGEKLKGRCYCPDGWSLDEDEITCKNNGSKSDDASNTKSFVSSSHISSLTGSSSSPIASLDLDADRTTEASMVFQNKSSSTTTSLPSQMETETNVHFTGEDAVWSNALVLTILGIVILILLGTIVALIMHLRKTRSIPLLTKPFYVR